MGKQYYNLKIYARVKDMVHGNTQKACIQEGDCYKKFENHLNRKFHVEKPNEKWCTDFTYIILEDGRKRYNCSMIDLYDRSVVATQNSSHIDAALAMQTLEAALERNRHPKNLLLHSNQGSQYPSQAFTNYCKAQMESFYGTLKAEFIHKHRFLSDDERNNVTMDYVYIYYNHVRPHSSNHYMTPFEKRM